MCNNLKQFSIRKSIKNCIKKRKMADEMEKKLMRLKKEDLKEEARLRSLSETGTKAELVSL